MPKPIASSRNAALIRSRLSAAERPRKLRRRFIPDFYELLLCQLLKQRDKVAAAAVGLDLILREQYSFDFGHRPGLLDELPDPGPHFVEAVVQIALEVEYGHLPAEIAVNLFLYRHDGRMLRNHSLHVRSS